MPKTMRRRQRRQKTGKSQPLRNPNLTPCPLPRR